MSQFKPKDRADCIHRYGSVSIDADMGLVWRDAVKWVKPWKVPESVSLILSDGRPVYRIFCKSDIHAPLTEVFDELIWTGHIKEIRSFDGCFNVRWVRGMPGIESFHSWAIALDFNAGQNPLGASSQWSAGFVDIWKAAGWAWGGDFKRKDPMHFEWLEI